MHRLNICLDPEMVERLRAIAEARGTSVAGVIRDAVDIAIPADPIARAAALRRLEADVFLAATPVDDPEPVRTVV
jgi:hypothetical protein